MLKSDCYYCGTKNVQTVNVWDYEGIVAMCRECHD